MRTCSTPLPSECADGAGTAPLRRIPRALLRFIGEDHWRVFAVRGDQQRARREDALQRIHIVYQHVARGSAHEHLHAAGLGNVHALDRLQIVVGGPKVEGVVGHGSASGEAVLGEQRFVVDGLRLAVRHLHVAGDATGHGCPRFGCDVALVGEAGLAKMHLIVDHARQQPRAVQGDLAPPGQARADALNAAVGNAHIAFERAAFVDDGGVFQHPIHMWPLPFAPCVVGARTQGAKCSTSPTPHTKAARCMLRTSNVRATRNTHGP